MHLKAIRNNQTAIIWLSLAHLVNDIDTGFLNPIMPYIAETLGFTMGVATILLGITQICSNLFQPIFGYFADNTVKRVFIFLPKSSKEFPQKRASPPSLMPSPTQVFLRTTMHSAPSTPMWVWCPCRTSG